MSLSQAVKDYLSGITISQAEITKRKETCLACKQFGYRKTGIRFENKWPFVFWKVSAICNTCGCFLDGKLGKWAAPKEFCPKAYWFAVPQADLKREFNEAKESWKNG